MIQTAKHYSKRRHTTAPPHRVSIAERIIITLGFTSILSLYSHTTYALPHSSSIASSSIASASITEQAKSAPPEFILNYSNEPSSATRSALSDLHDKNSEKLSKSSLRGLALSRWLDAQKQRYLAILHAEGYYSATIDLTIQDDVITFIITPDTRYTWGEVTYSTSDAHHPTAHTPLEELPLPAFNKMRMSADYSARAKRVLAAEKTIAATLIKSACVFDVTVTHRADLDRTQKKVHIVFMVDAAPKATFGAVEWQGVDSISKNYVQNLLPWKQGSCFNRTQLVTAQTDLLESRLFNSATITLADTPKADGSVPITIRVIERLQRTYSYGAHYGTDIGPGISAGWEHRNFLGNGETLKIESLLAAYRQDINATGVRPFFLRDDQALSLSTRILHDDNEAYEELSISSAAIIDRVVGKQRTAGAGVRFVLSEVTQAGITDSYTLLSTPLYYSWDKRNDTLEPTEGYTLRFDISPTIDALSPDSVFAKTSARGTYYMAFDYEDYEPVLALRAATGSILGQSATNVPVSERFYTGGGSSVRGYAYQSLGPHNTNEPQGGTSFIELSTEMRAHFSPEWGGVLFVDAGNGFDEAYLDFKEPLQFGAGVGVRYYTDFGPVRADLAIPVNARTDDAPFQFYISLGQAF